jgi:HlyD family type I secretion membrane fusion protein
MSKNHKGNLPAIPPGARPPVPLPARTTVKQLQRATGLVDRLANHIIPYDAGATNSPEQSARPTIMVGMMTILVLFVVVGIWGALWPLASGAIAPGKVVVDSNVKDIQHLEGGIIKDILVRNGHKVSAGQVLLRLDNTSAQSRSDEIRGLYLAAKATEARLIAMRDGLKEVTFPAELLAEEPKNPKLREILDTQRRLFITKRDALNGQVSVLNQKMAQSQQEINGLRQQVSSADMQINLLQEEIMVKKGLLEKGNALRPQLLALQRNQAQIVGQRGQSLAMISRAEQAINEAKIAILNQKNQVLNDAVSELKETQVQISTLEERTRTSSDITKRIEITSPIAGTITKLNVHTVGGVVRPGEILLSVVPINDKLIVEARISPNDIASVHEGLEAQVRLSAFRMRYLRPVKGKLISVSADRIDDPRTGEAYFLARVEIPQSELQALGDLQLTPGMPAETLIVTGSRTMISYLVQPIRDSFGHAFHEQ